MEPGKIEKAIDEATLKMKDAGFHIWDAIDHINEVSKEILNRDDLSIDDMAGIIEYKGEEVVVLYEELEDWSKGLP
ncbi:hypothetical protein H6G33_09865 [Calothrix sp. FACHB-1219]|uniref:hypothetical protein n=1 Tax=unclassified Calothrix TaxID=2619626 RepID=UPI001688BBD6|nr:MULTISPECIES: hypothetical protein [unclassified Calothrix]MBD2201652.1 hypothetical protein [Calothrix sp. FACHB-168]MBD2217338.1 hypothetical protein [Calothrix sp. FACHB-1219]